MNSLKLPSLPWGSYCAWCRTAGGWWCSPCCGRTVAWWHGGTSAWPAPWGRRWPGPPPWGPSPRGGVWERTQPPRPPADAWCGWRLLLLPQPACEEKWRYEAPTNSVRVFIFACMYLRWFLLTWLCVCGPSALPLPPRSSTRCGSCLFCEQRLRSWLWIAPWSYWCCSLWEETLELKEEQSIHLQAEQPRMSWACPPNIAVFIQYMIWEIYIVIF